MFLESSSLIMCDEKADLLIQYQNISNKLRKKRILKKPNVTEASQQFENLGIICEKEDLPHYAGLSYQAAAKCQNTLGNQLDEGFLLLKSSRNFMSSYLKHLDNNFVLNESYFHHSYKLYKDCLERLKESKTQSKCVTEAVITNTILEMADNLRYKAGFIEGSCEEYENALKYISNSPLEKINCIQKLVSAKIELGDYNESLKLVNKIVEETKFLPDSGVKDDILCSSEITRTFLLLILQPTPQQISPAAASILEKYAWIETSNSNEIKDLQTTLKHQGLSMLSEDLFLKLQSLVMACQYHDVECLPPLENDLLSYLNSEQRMLLKILIKLYEN